MKIPTSIRMIRKRQHSKQVSRQHEVPPNEVPRQIIDNINELTNSAKTSWFLLLSFLVFIAITLLGVEDADFFIPSRQTQLPILGVSIPTAVFFWVAPALAVALYSYFHLQLLKLFEGLARLNGASDLATYGIRPWLVSDFVFSRRRTLKKGRPLQSLTFLTVFLLVYLAGPLILGFFWFQSWPYHNELLTILGCGIPFMLSLLVGASSWNYLYECLYPNWRLRYFSRLFLKSFNVCASVAVVILGWLTTEGSFERYARAFFHFDEPVYYELVNEAPSTPELMIHNPAHSRWWGHPLLNAFIWPADLSGVDFVQVPEDWRERDSARQDYRSKWCQLRGIDQVACGPASEWLQVVADDVQVWVNLSPAQMAIRDDARRIWCDRHLPTSSSGPVARASIDGCEQVFESFEVDFRSDWEVEWNAQLARLSVLNLSGADLRRANLVGAQLQGANLSGALLEGANFSDSQLQSVDLSNSNIREALFYRASMQLANVEYATAEGAVFESANARQARLRGAKMQAAYFYFSEMQAVDFWDADLPGADFTQARLQNSEFNRRTNLRGTRFQLANLQGSTIHLADFEGANFVRADLRNTGILNAPSQGANFQWARLPEN